MKVKLPFSILPILGLSGMPSFFVFAVLLPAFSVAQEITVSEEVHLRSDKSYEIIGMLNNETLLFRDHNSSYDVQGFDQEMQLSWTKELELDKKQPKVLGVQQIEDEFVVIYRFRQRSKTIVKVHRYDSRANLLDSVTVKNFGFQFSTPLFEVVRSEDRSKILIYHIEKQKILKALVFDIPSMTVMWEKGIQPKKMQYPRDWEDLLVDDQGNMHLILSKDNYRSKRKTHYFQVHQYYGMQDQVKQFNLPMQDKLSFDVNFNVDNRNNQLVAAGLYGVKTVSKAMGYYYLRIPLDNHESHSLRFHEFEEDMLNAFLEKKVKKNRGLVDAVMDDVVLRRDGGILAIIEKAKLYERRPGSTPRSFNDPFVRTMVDYYHEEMYIVSIHPDGRKHWGTILHKKQYSQDEDAVFASYFLFTTPSSLRFIFNDEIKYENTVSEYVLRGDGTFKRNSVLNTKDLKIRMRFRDATQVNAKVLLVPSEMRNRLKIVKLQY